MIAAIGLDIGTTRVKAALVSPTAKELVAAVRATPWELVAGQYQVDMVELGALALQVAAEVAEVGRAAGLEIVSIAATGMAETGALLDDSGRVLAPGFAWHHTLGDAARVRGELGADEFILRTGRDCTLSPSIIKLDHLRATGHRFEPGQVWLNVPDYVAWRLCGVRAAEISTSSRSGLVDVVNRCWWAQALDFLGAGPWLVPPELLTAGTPLGEATGDIPGVLRGIQVSTGGHDHPIAAISLGGDALGTLDVSLGTAEAQLRIVATDLSETARRELVAAGASIDWHPYGDRYTVLLAVPTGVTQERLATLLGVSDRESRRALSEAALQQRPARIRLVDVTLDDFGIAGISDLATKEGIWRAAVEQLTTISEEGTARINGILGEPDRIFTFGGWINDPLVASLRRPLGQVPSPQERGEPGATGAALMALKGAGVPGMPGPGRWES